MNITKTLESLGLYKKTKNAINRSTLDVIQIIGFVFKHLFLIFDFPK